MMNERESKILVHKFGAKFDVDSFTQEFLWSIYYSIFHPFMHTIILKSSQNQYGSFVFWKIKSVVYIYHQLQTN